MKTLLLCDRESVRYDGLDLCAQTQTTVQKAGGQTQTIILNCQEIKPCRGCFHCWLKTPGLCVMTDDCANTVSRQEIQADAVILLSKITYGGYSGDVKAFLDRSIPNISPFFELVKGTMRHRRRYDRFPYLISIGYDARTPKEQQTFLTLAERNALNMRPPQYFAFTMQSSGEVEATMQALEDILRREVWRP
ncbi:MAG: flavodoxin family protein [Firmicutes bacterium]|nr:flavodoxin family protein [Bacillota bacterium]